MNKYLLTLLLTLGSPLAQAIAICDDTLPLLASCQTGGRVTPWPGCHLTSRTCFAQERGARWATEPLVMSR